MILCALSLLFALFILLTQDIKATKNITFFYEVKDMGKDLVAMLKTPLALTVMILVVLPIGTGAMSNLWSAIAKDWKTDANTVVWVTGLLNGLISVIGCSSFIAKSLN